MRVLICAPVPLSAESAYWHWLKVGTEADGHQVVPLDVLGLQSLYGPSATERLVLQAASAYQVNVALILADAPISVPLLARLRQLGVVLVRLRDDDGRLTDPVTTATLRASARLDRHCDLVVTCRRGVPAQFAERGWPPPSYLPMPFSAVTLAGGTQPLRPVVRFSDAPGVRAGVLSNRRVQLVRALLAAGLPVELAHPDWRLVPGCAHLVADPLRLSAVHAAMASATVNVCLAADGAAETWPSFQLSCLQVAATGGMLLTEPCDEFGDFFIDGLEALTVRSPAEGVAQARAMLAQPEAARRIGRSGRQALLRSHSWQHWWERVAGQLETRGKHLDLAAPPREAQAAHRPGLAMAMTGLAHLHEGQGQPAEADAYFQQVLSWYPGDYAALAGMARRSPDPRTRQSYWRRAVQDQPARHQLWHGLFPTRVLGPSGTAFRDEAGIQLLLGAMNLGDYATAADALYGLAGLNSRFALPFIRQLLRVGEVASAARCLTAALGFWPDDVHLLGLQATWSAEAGPGQ